MRLREVALGVAVSVSLLACSGSSSSAANSPRPLTKDETVRMKATVLSFAEVTSLATDLVAKRPAHSLFKAFETPVSDPSSPLKKMVDEADCQKTIHYPDEQPALKSGDNQLPVFSIDISGPGCPVTYQAELHGTQMANGLNAVLSFKYQARSDEARQTNDVDMSDLTGTISATQDQSPDGTTTMNFAMDFGGKGHSQKEGDFAMGDKIGGKISVSMGGGGAPGQQPPPGQGGGFPNISINGQMDDTTTFTFHDMTAEMVAHTSMFGMQQQVEYRINGQVVTEQEYKDLHDAMKIPALQPADDQNQTPSSALLSCTARVYPGSQTPAALQAELDQGHLPMMPGLTEFHSCSDNKSIATHVDQMGAGRMQSSFDFTNPGFVKAEVTYCEGTAPCQTAQRYFIPNDTKGFAETLGNYTVVTFCETKPTCF